MASHGTFRLEPWVADHFTLYSSRTGRSGPIYTAEATYDLTC
jgi:2'-5' RNA ligase